ncbi:MAG: sodium:solute symporter family protein [Chloroflexi bacterium]|nr:sodium:solute symporter family protein [Chloroflexota bacterium]
MLQLTIIVIYLAGVVLVGLMSRRHARGADSFFVAGRRGSSLLITGSLLATILGASATLGMTGLGYRQGLTGGWWVLVGTVGLVFLGLFLAKKVRDFAVYTLPEIIEKQYDRRVALAASVLIVVAWIGIVAAQMLAAGKIMSVLGIGDPVLWMVVIALVTTAYTAIGGQHSVIRTDFVQAAVLFGGVFAGAVMVLVRVGGWGGLTTALPADRFAFPVSAQFGWLDLTSMLFLVGLTYLVGPDMYSRLFCAKDHKVARKSALLTALLLVPAALAIVVIGMGSAVLFPTIAPEQAFPAAIKEVFSPLLGGLILAALLAAVMSSADTTMLSASTILMVDVFGSRQERREKLVAHSRWAVALIGTAGLIVALLLNGIVSALMFAYTIYTAGVILPVLAGFFKERLKVTSLGALAALIGGGGLGLASKFLAVKYLDLGALLLAGVLLLSVSFVDNRLRRPEIEEAAGKTSPGVPAG